MKSTHTYTQIHTIYIHVYDCLCQVPMRYHVYLPPLHDILAGHPLPSLRCQVPEIADEMGTKSRTLQSQSWRGAF